MQKRGQRGSQTTGNTDRAIPQGWGHQKALCRASRQEPGSEVLEASSLSKIMGRKQIHWRSIMEVDNLDLIQGALASRRINALLIKPKPSL